MTVPFTLEYQYHRLPHGFFCHPSLPKIRPHQVHHLIPVRILLGLCLPIPLFLLPPPGPLITATTDTAAFAFANDASSFRASARHPLRYSYLIREGPPEQLFLS